MHCAHLPILRTPCPIVLLQHLLDAFCPETSPDMLVHPTEYNPIQPVKLLETDGRRWIPGAEPNYRRLDLWWRAKVAFADFHDVFYPSVQLDVGC